MERDLLIDKAKEIRKRAYTPYSNYPVGAALETKEGNIYVGCNIENAAYPVTCCAERVAIFAAIANGEKAFTQIAVVADSYRPVSPCGSCRQVMSEFFDKDVKIHIANLTNETKTVTMEELLPFSFNQSDMRDK